MKPFILSFSYCFFIFLRGEEALVGGGDDAERKRFSNKKEKPTLSTNGGSKKKKKTSRIARRNFGLVRFSLSSEMAVTLPGDSPLPSLLAWAKEKAS